MSHELPPSEPRPRRRTRSFVTLPYRPELHAEYDGDTLVVREEEVQQPVPPPRRSGFRRRSRRTQPSAGAQALVTSAIAPSPFRRSG